MMKPLKIFVDAHAFDGGYQGSRTFIKELYTALSHDPSVDIYMGACDVETLKNEFPDIPAQHFIRYRSKNSLVRIVIDIPYILRHHHFDFAHFQYISPLTKPCKFIVTTHDLLFLDFKKDFPWSYRILRNRVFKRSCKKADIITTPSVFSQDEIHKYYHIPSEKIVVVPNGISAAFFKMDISKKEAVGYLEKRYHIRNYILYVSRIEPRKNHALLLELFLDRKFYKKGISLVFIGEESIKDKELQKMKKEMPSDATPYFRHLYGVTPAELMWFYKGARLVVYPSRAEGFGIPPLEAAAVKTPVLCSQNTAMAAFRFFGEGLFNPENKGEFSKKLDKMLSERFENSRLEEIASAIHQEYTGEKSGEKLVSFLRQNTLI